MQNKRKLGSCYEEWAAAYLNQSGYEIIEKNYYCKAGELDLIARHNGYLVFIEIKYRKTNKMGDPGEAVTGWKQKRIYQSARYYMLTHGYREDQPCRFDVVAILGSEVRVIEHAFY